MISEVNNYLGRDALVPRNLEKVSKMGRKSIPVKWKFYNEKNLTVGPQWYNLNLQSTVLVSFYKKIIS